MWISRTLTTPSAIGSAGRAQKLETQPPPIHHAPPILLHGPVPSSLDCKLPEEGTASVWIGGTGACNATCTAVPHDRWDGIAGVHVLHIQN